MEAEGEEKMVGGGRRVKGQRDQMKGLVETLEKSTLF